MSFLEKYVLGEKKIDSLLPWSIPEDALETWVLGIALNYAGRFEQERVCYKLQ